MADVIKKYSDTALILLRANLGYYGTDIPDDLLIYLNHLLGYSFDRLAAAGIRLVPGELYDDQLQVMYAAWLYRKGGEGGAKPPMLQQAIRDRQVENALQSADEEVTG